MNPAQEVGVMAVGNGSDIGQKEEFILQNFTVTSI